MMISGLRKTVSVLLGLVALIGSLLAILPRLGTRLWLPQLVMTEGAWLSTLASILSLAVYPARWFGAIPAIIGGVMSLVPLFGLRRVAQNSTEALRHGLGARFDEAIAPPIREQLPDQNINLTRMFRIQSLPTNAIATHDVVYRTTPHRDLKLDVYQPHDTPAIGTTFPAIIVVHGGSWRYGDKGQYFSLHHRYLAEQGYVVFDIQYRLSHEVQWPEPYLDVIEAIHWVKEHAALYHVDPDRIALLGRSAGGHLALHAAYRAPETARVAAVVAYYPPIELRLWEVKTGTPVALLMGRLPQEAPELYDSASVLTQVQPDSVPTLLVHGLRDELVTVDHVELLAQKLRQANVPHSLIKIPWARHGFDGAINSPNSQIAQNKTLHFLAWALYSQRQVLS